MEHDDPKATPWEIDARDFPREGSPQEKWKFLLRYAILAPSTRNIQPWKFAAGEREIRVFLDKTHWQRIADADQRELYLSVGCALENLLIAAEHFGYRTQARYFPSPLNPDLVAEVSLTPESEFRESTRAWLFSSIPAQHTNHGFYEPCPIPAGEMQSLQNCCTEAEVDLLTTSDAGIKRKADALIARADALEFANPAFREEVAHRIGTGAFGASWLLSVLGQLAVSYLDLGAFIAQRDHDRLMSAPVFGLVAVTRNDRETQVKAGQVFERLCLAATSMGLRVHPISQLVQLPEIQQELPLLLPCKGLIPMQPFRMGYAPSEPHHTPRKPLESVLIA